MRIVTRADFDGVVCAVLLRDALDITNKILWVEPSDMQKGKVNIKKGDIIANLPFHEKCSLWFDHHLSNRIDKPYRGLYRVAPSAAGLVYEYYKERLKGDFEKLVAQADKIDSADLTREEVLHPEKFPCVLLSMTINNNLRDEEPYWDLLVDLLARQPLEKVFENEEVKKRCKKTIEDNARFEEYLKKYTTVNRHVAITDFRPLDKVPSGNRFLAYCLFPETVVSVKIRYADEDKNRVIVSVGHSIFNRGCNVNVGEMLSRFEGGGHRGAGACTFTADKADKYIPQIIDILLKNEKTPSA